MPSIIGAATLSYLATTLTTFTLYPYRDFTKHFTISGAASWKQVNGVDYCVSRYRGMLMNPSQLLLISAPTAFLYGGYVCGGGGFGGAMIGGLLHGNCKAFVATIARRMGGGSARYSPLDQRSYASVIDCVRTSGAHYGFYSFFCGALAMSLISIIWHGGALILLQQESYRGKSFGRNFWDALTAHAFMTFATAPLRNVFHSSLVSRERSGGVKTVSTFMSGEAAVFREAWCVCRNVGTSEGLSFFFSGVIQTTFKTCIPFALTYAVFRFFGGSIGDPSGRRGGHGGFRRRFMAH